MSKPIDQDHELLQQLNVTNVRLDAGNGRECWEIAVERFPPYLFPQHVDLPTPAADRVPGDVRNALINWANSGGASNPPPGVTVTVSARSARGPDVALYIAERGGVVAVHDINSNETMIGTQNVDGEVYFARIPDGFVDAKNNVGVVWEEPRDDHTYIVWVMKEGGM